MPQPPAPRDRAGLPRSGPDLTRIERRPREAEREEIYRIHLERRKRDPGEFDCAALAAASEGMSGAEIEAMVIEGLWRAYPLGRDLLQEDIAHSIRETVPLSRTMAESIDSLRAWAASRARPAS